MQATPVQRAGGLKESRALLWRCPRRAENDTLAKACPLILRADGNQMYAKGDECACAKRNVGQSTACVRGLLFFN